MPTQTRPALIEMRHLNAHLPGLPERFADVVTAVMAEPVPDRAARVTAAAVCRTVTRPPIW